MTREDAASNDEENARRECPGATNERRRGTCEYAAYVPSSTSGTRTQVMTIPPRFDSRGESARW